MFDDPDAKLVELACGLAETNNPYYAWQAIAVCTTHKKEFPEWVRAYLAECAERMNSPKAEKSRDLRRDLPWIIGFPSKHGPGNLLDPTQDGPDPCFALIFAMRLEQGDSPVEALHNACNEVFDKKIATKFRTRRCRGGSARTLA